jgi:hypothetical protein
MVSGLPATAIEELINAGTVYSQIAMRINIKKGSFPAGPISTSQPAADAERTTIWPVPLDNLLRLCEARFVR